MITRLARPVAPAAFLAVLVSLTVSSTTAQTPTRVMIRVVAHDAKIIGSGVGGARITVTDAETGQLLASGEQGGGTGDTQRIIRDPRRRHETVFDTQGAGGFLAELPLTRPTRVRISAEGPLGTPHAVQQVATTMLLVPGQHVEGDGIVLVLHGFTVTLESPGTDDLPARAGEAIHVVAGVTMLCGCPTEPGGLWNADAITIVARVLRDGHLVAEDTLAYAGRTSTYAGTVRVPDAGSYDLEVLAMDASHANFGMVRRPVEVR